METPSKLDKLSEKSANKNGQTANYINACQALRDDIISVINMKMAGMAKELTSVKENLKICKSELLQSKNREEELLKRISLLEKPSVNETAKPAVSRDDFYLVGSSLLREVEESDILNGKSKCIRGGLIDDVKQDIKTLSYKPKNIILQIGGNDLDREAVSVEQAITDYSVMVAKTTERYPDSKVIISGLLPRFKDENIRSKVKQFNQGLETWAGEHGIPFIDNEAPFELRSGDTDVSAYVTIGECPNVHLTREGTVRMLKNIGNVIPELKLSDMKRQKQNYAAVVRNGRKNSSLGSTTARRRGCFNCSETNHVQSQCKFSQKIRCLKCHRRGHKQKLCKG